VGDLKIIHGGYLEAGLAGCSSFVSSGLGLLLLNAITSLMSACAGPLNLHEIVVVGGSLRVQLAQFTREENGLQRKNHAQQCQQAQKECQNRIHCFTFVSFRKI
jgi:hypothetical protein